MILKTYQTEALDWLEAFFKRCKAHEETTRDWRGEALHNRPLTIFFDRKKNRYIYQPNYAN